MDGWTTGPEDSCYYHRVSLSTDIAGDFGNGPMGKEQMKKYSLKTTYKTQRYVNSRPPPLRLQGTLPLPHRGVLSHPEQHVSLSHSLLILPVLSLSPGVCVCMCVVERRGLLLPRPQLWDGGSTPTEH